MRSICLTASAAPRWPSSASCSMRERRERTSANSAATKNPFRSTKNNDRDEQ